MANSDGHSAFLFGAVSQRLAVTIRVDKDNRKICFFKKGTNEIVSIKPLPVEEGHLFGKRLIIYIGKQLFKFLYSFVLKSNLSTLQIGNSFYNIAIFQNKTPHRNKNSRYFDSHAIRNARTKYAGKRDNSLFRIDVRIIDPTSLRSFGLHRDRKLRPRYFDGFALSQLKTKIFWKTVRVTLHLLVQSSNFDLKKRGDILIVRKTILIFRQSTK